MNRIQTTLLLVLLSAPSGVLAAEPGRALRERQAPTYSEVERGVYVGVSAGPWFLLNPPAVAGRPRPFSPGQMAEVELGVDIGERLSVGIFLMASTNRAGSDYLGLSAPQGTASGDFSTFIPGVTARFSLVGFNDSQDVKRTWIYLRGGAGYAMYSPKALLPNSDVLLFAGPGIEYYTRLRHFSIGLEVSGAMMLSTATIGFAITPNLRYAF